MPANPDITTQFFQYSSAIADASYALDYCTRVVVGATSTASVSYPLQANALRIRSATLTDVGPAIANGAPGNGIACYFRIDGQAASASTLAGDGSTSRILRAGEKITLNRFVATENKITIFNPNGSSVTLQVELGG